MKKVSNIVFNPFKNDSRVENIPFELYSEIDIDNFNIERDKIEYIFSKEYNRQRYIEIYEN